MKKTENDYLKKELISCLEYNEIDYIREECEMNGGFHTIKWDFDDPTKRNDDRLPYYYSFPLGWSNETGYLNVNQPIPELEIEFKKIMI